MLRSVQASEVEDSNRGGRAVNDDELELAREYQQGKIDRRTLLSKLLVAGLSGGAAAAFVGALSPGTAAAATEEPGAVPAAGGKPVVTKLKPNAGPLAGGNKVTVVGTGLLGATKVAFGTKAAKIKSTSATKLVVVAPAGTGTVDVVVTTAKGKSATGTHSKYTYVHAPVVTAVSPNHGTEHGGTTVLIAGKNLSHLRSVTFGTATATVSASTATSVTVKSPAHALTSTAVKVDIRVKTAGGMSAITAADKFTYKAGAPTPPTPTPTPTPPTPTPTPSCSSCGCSSCGCGCSSCGCSFCASCSSCCCGGCALPDTTTSVRKARAGVRSPDKLFDARGKGLSPLSRSRSRGAALRPMNTRSARDS